MIEFFNIVLVQPIANFFAIFYSLSGGSFILGIFLVTLLIKTMLFPLYKSQYESTRRLKKAKPRIDKINKKYKDDALKKQQEISKVYKEINYKPLGCFLNLLIQIPMVLSLYAVIKNIANSTALPLYGFVSSFLGINGDFKVDLYEFGIDFTKKAKDYVPQNGFSNGGYVYIIGIVLVIALQATSGYQSFSQTSIDTKEKEKNEKDKKKKKDEVQDPLSALMGNQKTFLIMNTAFMAVMIGNFAWQVPLGLSVYWIMQSALQIAQQFIVKLVSKES